jgi:hypothetical protein
MEREMEDVRFDAFHKDSGTVVRASSRVVKTALLAASDAVQKTILSSTFRYIGVLCYRRLLTCGF